MSKGIRKEVEEILGFHILDWTDTFQAAEIQGKLTGAKTNRILRILCERMEALEARGN